MKEIVLFPNKVLRAKTPAVLVVDNQLVEELEELKKKLLESENGAGLAATQLGIEKRFFGLRESKTKVRIYINPRIKKTWGAKMYPKIINPDNSEEDFLEGCLSFPDLFGTVKRFIKIQVEWEEVEGNKLVTQKKELFGFPAIVFQHEADHLDGVLFVDHIKREGGKLFRFVGENTKTEVRVDEVLSGER